MNQKLIDDIDIVWTILVTSKENLLFSKYFLKSQSIEEKNYLASSKEFKYIHHSLWRLCVIDLHKLFSESNNDRFRLNRLIEDLEGGRYSEHSIPDNIIMCWKDKIAKSKHTIFSVKTLRNKIYAHTDIVKDLTIDIDFNELEDLISIVEMIIEDIYKYELDSGISKNPIIFNEERFKVIKILAKEKNDRIQKLESLLQKKDNKM